MTSVSAGHIILTPTQPVGNGVHSGDRTQASSLGIARFIPPPPFFVLWLDICKICKHGWNVVKEKLTQCVGTGEGSTWCRDPISYDEFMKDIENQSFNGCDTMSYFYQILHFIIAYGVVKPSGTLCLTNIGLLFALSPPVPRIYKYLKIPQLSIFACTVHLAA